MVSVFTVFYWKAMAKSHITVSNDLFILKLPSPNHKLTQNVQQLQKECFMLFRQFWNELRKRVNGYSHCSWGGRNHWEHNSPHRRQLSLQPPGFLTSWMEMTHQPDSQTPLQHLWNLSWSIWLIAHWHCHLEHNQSNYINKYCSSLKAKLLMGV